jgi:predicted AAA+ superfamily ATPase
MIVYGKEVNRVIKRDIYLSKIKPFYHSELIKVLIGIRRSGKSVILNQIMHELMEEGIDKENIIYINFEDLDYADICDAKKLHAYIKERIINKEEKYYLFFDEIQVVTEFERAINSFRAVFNTSIFITGTNGKLLSGELATYLSGRYISFRIMPFNFYEVYSLNRNGNKEDVFMEFLEWGGMPQRFQFSTLEETKVVLNDLYNSIVLRDIVQRTGGKDVNLLNGIIEYLIQTPSQSFSAKSISKYFESENRKVAIETLYNYLDHIVSSLIMTKAGRYDIRGKKLLTTLNKYYLMDMGLGRIRNSGFKIEMGAMLENVVFNELLVRDYQVYVGKTKTGEVDFIAVKGNEKLYFQVAYYLTDEKVIERDFGAFSEIADNYPKYVLSMDKMDFSRDGIIHKNIIDFLLEEYK